MDIVMSSGLLGKAAQGYFPTYLPCRAPVIQCPSLLSRIPTTKYCGLHTLTNSPNISWMLCALFSVFLVVAFSIWLMIWFHKSRLR